MTGQNDGNPGDGPDDSSMSSAQATRNSHFVVDASDPLRPVVRTRVTPSETPRVIACFEFTSPPVLALFPSPGGRWLAVRASFPESPIPELSLLFVLPRDVAEPVNAPMDCLATLPGEASAGTLVWLDEQVFVVRGYTFGLEPRDRRDAWLVYDAGRDAWLDIDCASARPTVVPNDPDRAVLASSHFAPIERARALIEAAQDARIAQEALRVLHERVAFEKTYVDAVRTSPGAAAELLRDAIAMLPQWAAPRRELCGLLRRHEDWAALRAAADDWCRAQSLDADGAFHLAVALARTGEADAACDALRRALELDSGLRYLVEDEADFESLRGYDAFDRLVREPPP